MTASSILGMFGGPVYEKDEEPEIEPIQESDNQVQRPEKVIPESKKEKQKRELKEKAKMSLNAQCRCGSKKKYKSCCIYKDAKEE